MNNCEFDFKVIIMKNDNLKNYNLNACFVYDDETYGNGYYLSIVGDDFSELYYDLRYDRKFNKNHKLDYLIDWAKNYWTGDNGSYKIISFIIDNIDMLN